MNKRQNLESSKYSSAWLIGSSGGIGSALSSMLTDCASYTSRFDIHEILPEEGKSDGTWRVDASHYEQFGMACRESVSKYGPPDLVVVAAGLVKSGLFIDTSDAAIDSIYQNNFKIVTTTLRSFFELCDRSPEIAKSVVIISSNAALEPRPSQPVYAAMKSAINHLAQSQAVAWGKFNIRVNVVAPGTVVVERNELSLREKFPQFPLDSTRPLGRLMYPEDVERVCRVLLKKDLLITGQILALDGGSSLV